MKCWAAVGLLLVGVDLLFAQSAPTPPGLTLDQAEIIKQIQDSFQRYLDRIPTDVEVKHYLDYFRNGGRLYLLDASLLGGDEYSRSRVRSEERDAIIRRWYRDVLGLEATDGNIRYWSLAWNEVGDRTKVAQELVLYRLTGHFKPRDVPAPRPNQLLEQSTRLAATASPVTPPPSRGTITISVPKPAGTVPPKK